MKIVDTYLNIIELIDSFNGSFDFGLWENYVKQISIELFDKIKEDSCSYDFDKEILPVLTDTIESKEKLESLHNSFLAVVEGIGEKVKEKTGTNLQAEIVLYLGLCNGAGWATTLGGKPVVLLGVEKIVELGWYDKKSMIALIYHELGHLWHGCVGKLHQEVNTAYEKAVLQLYQEGFAMYFEQLLLNDFNHYHQDKAGWLEWCRENEKKLACEFLRCLKANESVQSFFGDWVNYCGHSDVGYFLGCELVKYLAQTHVDSTCKFLNRRNL